MAITNPYQEKAAQQPTAPQQTPQGAPQQQTPPQQQFNLRDHFRSVLPPTNAAEHVKKITDSWRKSIASMNLPVKITNLDNRTNTGSVSCIVVSMSNLNGNGRTAVAVHTVIVEASTGELGNRIFTNPAGNIEIPAVAGDAYDKGGIWEKVKNEIRAMEGNVDIINATASVIPREMSPDDEVRCYKVLMSAVEACYRLLVEDDPAQPSFSLSVIPKSDRIVARVETNPRAVETPTGLPIRSDISVTLSSTEVINQNNPFSSPVEEITVVDGFVELVYTAPPMPMHGMPPVTQYYHPRYIMTNIESRLGAMTLEILLLGVYTATLLGKDMTWATTFLPRLTAGDPLRDISAIGLDVMSLLPPPADPKDLPKPAHLDAKALQDINYLNMVIRHAIHPGLAYSIDIEECGSNSWLSTVFVAAANGKAVANQQIFDAANRLTNGHFGTFFKGQTIVNDDVNRIHLGYYTDSRTNTRRDIRSLDYLAALNWIGLQDKHQVVEWDATFNNIEVPLDLRLQKRTKLLERFFTDCKIKGYARRLTFSAEFIIALVQAMAKVDRVIQPGNATFDFGDNTRRGNTTVANYAVDPRVMAQNFNSYNSAGNPSGVGQMHTRWGD